MKEETGISCFVFYPSNVYNDLASAGVKQKAQGMPTAVGNPCTVGTVPAAKWSGRVRKFLEFFSYDRREKPPRA